MVKMGMERGGGRRMSGEEAQRIAVGALVHLAGNEDLLMRFVSLTGMDPADMRAAAGEPEFLAGILNFLLGHEPDAIAFAEEFEVPPDNVGVARLTLLGDTDPDPWTST